MNYWENSNKKYGKLSSTEFDGTVQMGTRKTPQSTTIYLTPAATLGRDSLWGRTRTYMVFLLVSTLCILLLEEAFVTIYDVLLWFFVIYLYLTFNCLFALLSGIVVSF